MPYPYSLSDSCVGILLSATGIDALGQLFHFKDPTLGNLLWKAAKVMKEEYDEAIANMSGISDGFRSV